jgi:hypothetical protein
MISKLISGGQTGVDRGALDAALDRGFPCGGWCPRGRRAEDGAIPPRYPLREMDTAGYMARTVQNVTDSDATLILASGPLTGGTKATEKHARKAGRPCLIIGLDGAAPDGDVDRIAGWIRANGIDVLNVAGPRESAHPGIEGQARRLVGAVLERIGSPVSSQIS